MMKFLKYLLITIVCFVLVFVIAGYVVLNHVDFNHWKNVVEEKVNEATGRNLVINNVQIKPSFSPTLQLKGVTFSNAEWSKQPQMFEAGDIDVGVAVLPLFHGQYVIDTFVIRDAVINLEKNAEGVANWEFETQENTVEENKENQASYHFSLIKEAYADESENVASEDVAVEDILSKIVVKQVAFDNVKINWADGKSAVQSYDIKQLALNENDDENIDFLFNVNDGLYQGKGVLGALKLLKSTEGYPVLGEFDILGININTDMMLFDALGDMRFDGKVAARGFLGKSSTYNEFADIKVNGNLHDVAIVIDNFSVADNVIKGDIEAKLDAKVPEISATLKSAKIDIASFKTEHKTAFENFLIKEAKATSLVSADKIPYNDLYAVNANVSLFIDKLVNRNNEIAQNLDINAKVDNGTAVLSILNGQLAKGSVKATTKLTAKSKSANLDVNLVKINLPYLLKALDADASVLSFKDGGNVDVYAKLTGVGNTYASVVDSLNGQLSIIIDKSQLHVGNIGLLKGNIVSQLLNTLQIVKNDDNLNLACAVVRTDIKDGLANFPNGVVLNADKFTIVANGDINLKNDKIGISIKPFGGKLTDTNIAKALSSLVRLTGTLQSPTVGVDTANAVKNIVGATMTGPVYLGAQMLMESDNSPCYTALKGTGYEDRFPKSENMVRSTGKGVGKALDDSVDMVKDTAKGLLNMFTGSKGKENSN